MLGLQNVTKCYGRLRAVSDLSLGVHRGEIFGLLGPNGAGKTTTMSLASGLLRPDGGTIELYGGGTPQEARVRRRIGLAPQSLSLYEELTGEENLRFFGRLHGLKGHDRTQRVEECLALVGLSDRRKDLVRHYSGGMKRRLNLAVAVLHQPDLLLLDEPTVGVDPQSRNAIFENILALRRKGLTVVYTTHYMEEAQRLCDRVGIIDHGRLLALDTVEVLIRAHGGRSVLVVELGSGEKRIETDDPLSELDRFRRDGELKSFRVERPTLEQVFLHLTGRELRDA